MPGKNRRRTFRQGGKEGKDEGRGGGGFPGRTGGRVRVVGTPFLEEGIVVRRHAIWPVLGGLWCEKKIECERWGVASEGMPLSACLLLVRDQ